jgi:hypothetical protein
MRSFLEGTVACAALVVALALLARGLGYPPLVPTKLKVKTGSVSGKVIFKAHPVRGDVSFITEEGRGAAFSGLIQEDGMYSIPDIPVGPAVVVVIVLPRVMAGPLYIGSLPSEKYKDPATSDLRFEVREGSQTFDIRLFP